MSFLLLVFLISIAVSLFMSLEDGSMLSEVYSVQLSLKSRTPPLGYDVKDALPTALYDWLMD